MDNSKDYNENCKLLADDETKGESSELKQENQSPHVTLYEKETAEGDENGRLLRRERDPKALESVHKYTNRIKSFLGWEPNEAEQTEAEEPTSEATDRNQAASLEVYSPDDNVNIDKDGDSLRGEKKYKTKSNSPEREQTNEEKGEPYLQTDHTSGSNLEKISIESESDRSRSTEMNPELEYINRSSSSLNNQSYLPRDNLKTVTSDSSENKSASEIKRSGSTTPELEQEKASDLENFPSFGAVLDDSVSPERNKLSDSDLEVAGDTEHAEEEKTVSDLEIDIPRKESVSEVNSSNRFEATISSTNVQENDTKGSNICENLEEVVQSADASNLYEGAPLRNNIKKPYMDEIRRLSLDIVKDVIESARSSFHEMFSNKNELETEDECTIHDDGSSTRATNGSKSSVTGDFKDITHTPTQGIFNFRKDQNKLSELKGNMHQPEDLPNNKECTVDEETVCGFGSFKPQWIQKYATPRTYLLLFSIVGIFNGSYYTYFASVMSTLEKRYAFTAKVSGILLLADEITPLILGVIVGYFGGKTHRPRVVAIGMLMSALCFFVSGLPYLIYGSAKHLIFHKVKNETGPELCETAIRGEMCDSDDRPPTLTVVGIFLLASFLKGFATLSYYVIGISYMDDNTKKKNTSIYLAVALALRLLGPLVGFLMSSAFLKIYENPFDDPGFGPEDPRWIGAWWMGFFLQGVFLLIFTLPIALFPRRLPSQKKLENLSPMAQKESIKETMAGLVSALKRLAKNPVFIVIIINTTMKIFGHFGHSIMLPKYMENQFRLSAADASLFSGATSITCIMFSTVLGGFLIWKFRPRIKLLLAGMVISEIILCIGFLILMIPRCQPADMLHFGMNDEGLILNNVCNQNCDCSTTSFTPFCGPDGKTTYFSPCYAGCTQELVPTMSSSKQKEFGNCSCVSVTDSTDPIAAAKITEGFCPDENCWSQTIAYLIILFVLVAISNTLTVAHTMILLRSVHPSDKSVALGTFETFICLFGFIPFPVTFGALVDSACLVWEESCGETGNCWFYDMEKYGYLLHGAAALFCSLSIICLITLYFLSPRVRNLYVEENDEDECIDSIKLDTVSGSVTKL